MHALFKKRLLAKERLIGTLMTLPSPELAEISAGAGFDWLFLDMEHGLLDLGAVQRLVQTVGERCPCLIRVPVNEEVWIKKALDIGPAGLIFPHLNTPEEAASVVRQSKYPPQGARSMGMARAQGYGARFDEYLASANKETTLVAQVEHIDAVRNIDWILDVPGIDAVFIGPYDLSASLNKPGRVGDPDVVEAIGLVRKACEGRGKPAGIFARDSETAAKALEQGFSFVCVGMDVTLFSKIASQVVRELKPA
jgi:2-keto-3-deoxy-L-rhamnonate aldolase RhmA